MNMKLVVVGPGAVGKTAACHVFTGKGFPAALLMTIGADFSLRVLNIDGQDIRVHLWDLAGQARFGPVRMMYYKGLSALVLMLDLTRPGSLTEAKTYLQQEIVPCISDAKVGCIAVVGNKDDLSDQFEVSDDDLHSLARETEELTGCRTLVFRTSAKQSESIEEMFTSLIRCTVNAIGLEGG